MVKKFQHALTQTSEASLAHESCVDHGNYRILISMTDFRTARLVSRAAKRGRQRGRPRGYPARGRRAQRRYAHFAVPPVLSLFKHLPLKESSRNYTLQSRLLLVRVMAEPPVATRTQGHLTDPIGVTRGLVSASVLRASGLPLHSQHNFLLKSTAYRISNRIWCHTLFSHIAQRYSKSHSATPLAGVT